MVGVGISLSIGIFNRPTHAEAPHAASEVTITIGEKIGDKKSIRGRDGINSGTCGIIPATQIGIQFYGPYAVTGERGGNRISALSISY